MGKSLWQLKVRKLYRERRIQRGISHLGTIGTLVGGKNERGASISQLWRNVGCRVEKDGENSTIRCERRKG